MTSTTTSDEERPTGYGRAAWANGWRILGWMRRADRTGKNFTRAEVADGVNMKVTSRAFSDALTAARKIASRHGEEITYCAYDGENVQYLRHLLAGQEQGKFFPGAATRTSSVVTQFVNLHDHLVWGAENCEDRIERGWAQTTANWVGALITAVDGSMKFIDIQKEERKKKRAENDASPA